MPQNAIIRANGTGDYTSIIAWEAAEQGSDYGSVTIGRVDGFFDQGASALIISGTWINGAKLEPFDSADAFDGTERLLCGLASQNTTRGIDFVTSTDVEIDGLEIIYTVGSGTDRAIEDSGAGTYTLSNCLVDAENSRLYIGSFDFTDTVLVAQAASSGVSNGSVCNFTGCNVFGQNTEFLVRASTSINTVCVNTGAGDCFSLGTQSNCASSDTTADTLTNIVYADSFVSATPIASKDYRIKSGSDLDTNGIGAFIQSGGGVTVTPTLGAIDYTSQNTTVSLTGSIDITTTLGTISYSSQDATISLTGDIDVTATLGSINYSSQNTTVSVTGDVDIIATLGAIDYTSQDATVVLSGLIDVTTTLGAIVYNSYPVTVQIGEGQIIGNVTAGFADSIYTAGFAGDIYTAGFKPDTITVSFK